MIKSKLLWIWLFVSFFIFLCDAVEDWTLFQFVLIMALSHITHFTFHFPDMGYNKIRENRVAYKQSSKRQI